MEVAIGIKAQIGRPVVPACQGLAGVTKRLEMADRIEVLKGCHGWTGNRGGTRVRGLGGVLDRLQGIA